MHYRSSIITTSAAPLLAVLPLVAGHGDEPVDIPTGAEKEALANHASMSYANYGHYGGWMLAHVVLMVMAWAMVMPVAIMLSTARSRYHLPAQIIFHLTNGLGIFTSVVYSHSAPELYVGNAHPSLGWVLTSFTMVWTLMSLYTAYGDSKSKRTAPAQSHGVTSQAMAEYNRLQQYSDGHESPTSWARDSGVGSSRHGSTDSIFQKPEEPQSPGPDGESSEDDEDREPETRGFLGSNKIDQFVSHHMRRLFSPRASSGMRFSQIFLEKVLLLLGFAAFASGFVVYAGISRDRHVFSILAHFIKGGIFFWYGVLTLGRWMGAFAEFGWAWNIRPDYPVVTRWKSRIPSAEFVESFVIWLYGASNVFLEHLNNWGKAWSAQDYEHVSITILFFGGGLLGMLIESTRLRGLMSTSVVVQKSRDEELAAGASRTRFANAAGNNPAADQDWQEPSTQRIPLNPMPGLVIMILGSMMSSHHQESMVSTMLHAQWGTLFFAFAVARATTYIILYIKSPTSHYPARPPSELVASFCLMAGGLMFIVSARDTVTLIESNGLDAMTIFTVTTGLTGMIMAWEFVCYAIKGWAVRKERTAAGEPLA